ncbi:MAG TPA: ABC transporter permease [Candidatus Polarisedimenticolia bacterium]|nr:ABC transporter permease [Candidatus Polarisedimenticolia bacterium]
MASRMLRRPGRNAGVAMRFLLRSLALRRGNFLMAIVAIASAATLTATLLALDADVRRKMSQDVRGFGPNMLVTPPLGTEGAILDEAALRGAAARLARAGIAVEPPPALLLLASGGVRPAGTEGAWHGATVTGAEFPALPRLNAGWKIEGAWPNTATECVVGSALAERISSPRGSSLVIHLGDHELSCHVSGVLATGESEEEQIFLPLSSLQEKIGAAGRVSLASFTISGGSAEVTRAARLLEKELPGAQARVLWQVAEGQGALLAKLHRLSLSLSLVVLVLCALCVMTTLLSSVLEREPEIGLMRSLGAGDGEILAMFLGEATILSLIGALSGTLVGGVLARLLGQRLFDAAVTLRWEVLPAVLGVSLALGWIAVLAPLRRALAVRPADALRGE